jgi:alanyl-tRNA synthetase
MPYTNPDDLRQRFLEFFDRKMKEHARAQGREVKGSLILPSSSLMPPDASTLFTSAGMHQFKDDFLGNLVHGTRACATVQKCMRTPDLENVGRTARHHTFFEMLGFFSFGDGLEGPNGSVGFFKREAIEWIWDFYTAPWEQGGCGLDKKKLYVSVYGGDDSGDGRDKEAADIWVDVLRRPGNFADEAAAWERIYFLGEHDNFWPAGAPSEGPNGVCGPCSEIFYDLGPEYGEGDVETNGDRFMEIGNIVFTQYERSGPTPGKGVLTPLPSKNIDFGGGFERLVMVLEGKKATLDTSLFTGIRAMTRYMIGSGWSGSKPLPSHINLSPPPKTSNADPFAPEFFEGVAITVTNVRWSLYQLMCRRLVRKIAAAHDTEIPSWWLIINDPLHAEFFADRKPWDDIRAKSGKSGGAVVDNQTIRAEAEVKEKRIADHIRAITFAMSDGILPSNEGAGYVIRRIIRRAFRDGNALGLYQPFLHKLAPLVVEVLGKGDEQVPGFSFSQVKHIAHYGGAYPSLRQKIDAIASTIEQEELQFAATLQRGLQLLAGLIRDLKAKGERTLPGKPAFDLYQSQGLPREVVQDELATEGLHLDVVGYEAAEEEHRQRSKGGKQVEVFEKGWFQEIKGKVKPTEFLGYETCETDGRILAIVRDGQLFDIIEKGDSATIILDRTPFYAESGGQVGDRGSLQHKGALFEVADTQKRDDIHLHEGKLLRGKLRVGDEVTARVDEERRNRIRLNHSATHLLHAALRTVLGEHVVQRGSEVGPERLRFDFSHPKALTLEERQQIEHIVNEQIRANTEVGTAIMSPEEAQQAGAVALFGEKYGEKVRVLSMGTPRGTAVPAVSAAGVPPAGRRQGAPTATDDQAVPGRGTHGRDARVTSDAPEFTSPEERKVRKRKGAYLPHWESATGTYFVTFRLADSLPSEKRRLIEGERDDIVRMANQMGRDLSDSERERLLKLHTEKMDSWLGAGYGACWFKDDRFGQTVADALRHFDGERYRLYAWCVMPNHVHVVFRPLREHGLTDILHSWKSFTAKECNKLRGEDGEFWMPEYFDRLIRDRTEFDKFVRYTLENPTQAGLQDWPWVWCWKDEKKGASALFAAGETSAELTGGTPVSRQFSMELCGGTHVSRTGDIGYFRIVSEGSSAAGIRRIEAVTGPAAYDLAAHDARLLAQLQELTKAQPGKVLEKVQGLVKEVKELKGKAGKAAPDAARLEAVRKAAQKVGEVTVVAAEVPGAESADLLTIRDTLGQDTAPLAVLLGSRSDGRALLLLSFSPELVARGLHAGKQIGEIARLVGGGGGGKPEVAQAGGRNPDGLAEALEHGRAVITEALQAGARK